MSVSSSDSGGESYSTVVEPAKRSGAQARSSTSVAEQSKRAVSYSSVYSESEGDETPQHCNHAAARLPMAPPPPPLPPPPLPPPVEPPPNEHECTPIGQASYAHLDVEVGADISSVAGNIRNHAPSVIIACCKSDEQATKLSNALSQEGFGQATRGNGEKGRSAIEDYQVQYRFAVHGQMVVAGRVSIVTYVRHVHALRDPQLGTMLICQLDFVVGINNSTHMRVAAIVADSTVVERRGNAALWVPFVNLLSDNTVRVLVFKDSHEHFNNTLCEKMQNTQFVKVCGPQPSFYVLGPVQKVTADWKNMFTYTIWETGDSSSKWPMIGEVKLKPPLTPVAHATCTFVIVGSSQGRRSEVAWKRRAATRRR